MSSAGDSLHAHVQWHGTVLVCRRASTELIGSSHLIRSTVGQNRITLDRGQPYLNGQSRSQLLQHNEILFKTLTDRSESTRPEIEPNRDASGRGHSPGHLDLKMS